LVLYRFLLDSIGVEKLGIWSIVLATASAARVSELGMAGSVTKFVAAYRAQGDDQAAAEALQTAVVSLAVVLGIVLILGYPGIFWALSHVLPAAGVEDGLAILPYALLSLWLTAVSSTWMSGIDGCLRTDLRAGIMIFSSIVFLISSFVGVEHFGLLGLAMAQVGQGVVLVILGWVFIRRIMPALPLLPIRWKAEQFRKMLGYGVNFQLNSVVMILFEPSTKILLGHYGELAAAGYFEMAQRMVTKVRALVVESNQVIVPVFAGIDAHGGDARDLYISNVRYMFFLITPVFAVLFALAPVISEIWIGSFHHQFVVMVACLTIAWYLNSITAPAYFVYLGQGRLRWVTVAHVIMGATNIIAGLVLGQYFGWQGLVVAFSVALALGSVIPTWAYHYENRLRLIQILSIQDAVLVVVCFGVSLISFLGFWFLFNAGGSITLRVVLILSGMIIIIAGVTWLHPLRRQIFIMIKNHTNRSPE
jgi:O-antigen/teichoic acid export membrane protein